MTRTVINQQEYLSASPEGTAAGQKVAMAGTSQQSSAIGTANTIGGVQLIDLVCDTDCFIEIGSNPTAVVDTSYYLVSAVPYRLPMTPGNKVAVIPASGSTGNLWIRPVG